MEIMGDPEACGECICMYLWELTVGGLMCPMGSREFLSLNKELLASSWTERPFRNDLAGRDQSRRGGTDEGCADSDVRPPAP